MDLLAGSVRTPAAGPTPACGRPKLLGRPRIPVSSHNGIPLAPSLQHCQLAPTQAPRNLRGCARATKTAAPVTDGQASLQPGDLVEFERDKDRSMLGLVVQADGKTKYFVLDQAGKRVSITPRQVLFRLPGSGWRESDLSVFSAPMPDPASSQVPGTLAAAALAGRAPAAGPAPPHPPDQQQCQQRLAEAWDMAAQDGITSMTLQEVSGLVLGDEAPLALYRTFKLLSADKVYFKVLPGKPGLGLPSVEPRAPEVVTQLKLQAQAEVSKEEDRGAWAAAAKQALAGRRRTDPGSREQWLQGPHAARIKALMDVAVKGAFACKPGHLELATDSLQLTGVHPPSPTAPSLIAGAHADKQAGQQPGLGALSDRMADLLVDLGLWRVHEPVAALRLGVQLAFSPQLEQAAQDLLAAPPPDRHAAVRRDLTHLRTVTIDDASTTEVDDGLSVEYLQDADQTAGGPVDPANLPSVRLWVHVADPGRWLPPLAPTTEPLLREAQARGRSLYFPWGVVPMFPHALAAGPFSLREGVVSDALSVGASLHPGGGLTDLVVTPTRIQVSHKLSYDDADALLAGPASSHPHGAQQQAQQLVRDLQVLAAVAKLHKTYREEQGSIEIPLPEAKVEVAPGELDLDRPVVQVQRVSQYDSVSRGLVAEMMILAGRVAGSIGAAAQLPLPYRGQPDPALPASSALSALPSGVCTAYALRRCMTRSSVAAVPQRHASLALDAYVQVTSPIRRFADLVAHANLKAAVLGEASPYSHTDIATLAAASGSPANKRFGQAEKGETAYWTAQYFLQSARASPHQEWMATVLGWVRQDLRLAAVLLDELGLEVVIKVGMEQVQPGDYVSLGLLEAQPLTGLLRFTVNQHFSQDA